MRFSPSITLRQDGWPQVTIGGTFWPGLGRVGHSSSNRDFASTPTLVGCHFLGQICWERLDSVVKLQYSISRVGQTSGFRCSKPMPLQGGGSQRPLRLMENNCSR